MFILGHLGFSRPMARPFRPFVSMLPWVMLGALVPDLIDKPLYYFLSAYHGKFGADLGLVSGARTFGHTLALLGITTLAARALRSRGGTAVAFGMATHLLCDHIPDFVGAALFRNAELAQFFDPWSDRWAGLFFPILGARFPVDIHGGLSRHLMILAKPEILFCEGVGAWILWREVLSRWWRGRQERL